VGCVRKLIELGATTFVEVGPGKVLTGLMRQIDRSQSAMNVEDQASLEKVEMLVERPGESREG
jgi:[acyl-carrier-protein] S-malonyltransferase